MTKFALKKIQAIDGKQDFYELLIEGESQLESFYSKIKYNTQLISEVKTILSYMQYVSDLKSFLPKEKFRDITPATMKIKEYEFKSKHLRAYVFHLEKKGKIVVYWGFKTNQSRDIKIFRSIKKSFLEHHSL